MRLDARRRELLEALGHRPLRLAGRLETAQRDAAVPVRSGAGQSGAGDASPALVRAIARAGRLSPAQVPEWLAAAGEDPSTAHGKRRLWTQLRAVRRGGR